MHGGRKGESSNEPCNRNKGRSPPSPSAALLPFSSHIIERPPSRELETTLTPRHFKLIVENKIYVRGFAIAVGL